MREPEPAPSSHARTAWFEDGLRLWAVVLSALIGLLIVWQVSHALLIIFAGLLLGVLLDACVRGLQRWLPLGRITALAASGLVLAGLFIGAVSWGGYQLVAQADELVSLMTEQIESWRSELEVMGLDDDENDESNSDAETLARFLIPDTEGWMEGLTSAFTITLGAIGDIIILVFAGLFVAASPQLYRSGLLSLVPRERRNRLGDVLDETAGMLRWWLLGQLFAMVLVGTTTWLTLLLIGMPSALVLGVQAGLLTFIPFIGPLVASIPIGLVALAHGTEMFIWAMAAYVVIQTVEGHLVTPLIHKQVVRLPPLLTLGAIMVFGILFGAVGVILAMPLAAVIRIMIIRLYVEDTLGGGVKAQ